MKKILTSMILAVSLIFCMASVYAATPNSDTYVLTYGNLDVYVKAGSLYRTDGGGYVDAAPQFECVLININRSSGRTKTYHATFVAKGMVLMEYEGIIDTSDFASELYEAICRKIAF